MSKGDENMRRIKSDLKKRRDAMSVAEWVAYLLGLQVEVRTDLLRASSEWTHYDPDGKLVRIALLRDAKMRSVAIQGEIDALIARSERERPAGRVTQLDR